MSNSNKRQSLQENESEPKKLNSDLATQPIEEELEFEDRYDSEFEDSEGEVIIDGEDDDETTKFEQENDELCQKVEDLQVYLPGQDMEEDEELVADQSAYDMLHSMGVEWPCLSFDIFKDKLGNDRREYPMTAYICAGSQAANYNENKLYLMKISKLSKTKVSEDESDDDDEFDEDPILEYKTLNQIGGTNRIRATNVADKNFVAASAETGKIHIHDVSAQLDSFDTPGMVPPRNPPPVFTITKHGTIEGYGLCWSTLQPGNLLTGDSKGRILLTEKTESGFKSQNEFFKGHTSSIEDIEWSPSQSNVFCSCSADKTIKIWDARTRAKPQISIVAHDTDVNVISWNKIVDYLLASGSDSGQFNVWDLRNWPSTKTNTPETAASFNWHQKPITSIEWHPLESSVLGVAGADDQITIWDLALERDQEEEIMTTKNSSGEQVEVPAQLLFIHQGQQNIKEMHWHKQIPGMFISTAFDGFNVVKTFNS